MNQHVFCRLTNVFRFTFRKNNLILLIFALLLVFSSCHPQKKGAKKLSVIYKELTSLDEIELVNDSLVSPIIYTNTLSLGHLPVEKKKETFISLILPAILVTRHHIENDRRRLLEILSFMEQGKFISKEDSMFLSEQKNVYKSDDPDILNLRMNTHPVSIVLAQAIVECGWGTSRFFKEANNVFGIWSLNPQEGRVPSLYGRNGKKIYLRKYDCLSSSIMDYFYTIGRGPAYLKFREKRLLVDNPYELIPYLSNYSELGQAYVDKLNHIIQINGLEKYDRYILDPSYFND